MDTFIYLLSLRLPSTEHMRRRHVLFASYIFTHHCRENLLWDIHWIPSQTAFSSWFIQCINSCHVLRDQLKVVYLDIGADARGCSALGKGDKSERTWVSLTLGAK